MSALTPQRVLELLAVSAAGIRDLGGDVAPERAAAPAADGGWSMTEVLAHLRTCSDVWGRCIEQVLTQDQPTIRAVNPRTYARGTDYASRPWASSWREFLTQRDALLVRLGPLTDQEWSRAATVLGAGRPLRTTVLDYAERLATHERSHVRQLRRLAG